MIIKKHVTWGSRNELLTPVGILIHAVYNKLNKKKRFDAASIVDIFKQYGVAAHYLILRDGFIWELVSPDIVCWHAGKSWFKGINKLNNSFIGIEFIGDDKTNFEDEQYISGGVLINKLITDYNIDSGYITTHQIVSGPNVRKDYKWDPGPYFDMLKLGNEIYE